MNEQEQKIDKRRCGAMGLRMRKNSEKRCFSRSKQYKKVASVQIEEVEAKSGRAHPEKAKASEVERVRRSESSAGRETSPGLSLAKLENRVSLNDCFQSSVPSSGLADTLDSIVEDKNEGRVRGCDVKK